MSKFKIAIIGTGGRSVSYATHYAAHEEIEIAALVDPNPDHRRALAQMAEIGDDFEEYDDWRDLYEKRSDLDSVVITSPGHVHAEQAIAFLERGLPIALEKPIGNTEAECRRIVQAERAHGGRVMVGFVLRSTPFYSKVRELVAGGAIGPVIAIQADELVTRVVSSILCRNPYYRHEATGAGSLLLKCCHDMDILNWLMGCRPVAVSSMGSRMIFHPNPSLPDTCEQCGVAGTCKYYKEPATGAGENEGDRTLYRFIRESDRCIYNIDKDLIDNQILAIEYENGAVANFLMTFNSAGPRSGRNLHVMGLKGRVWGELHAQQIGYYDNDTDETTEFAIEIDDSGHLGGDRRLALQLLDMMKDPDYQPLQTGMDGYMGNILCFAAEKSRLEGRRVDIVYDDEGFAQLR